MQTSCEIVIGTVNGNNKKFMTRNEYKPGTLLVSLNGVALIKNSVTGWTEAKPNKFNMKIAPEIGDELLAGYISI